MTFEEQLVRIRKEKGLNQEQLAEHIGVSRQAVSKWETGEAMPDYAKLVTLADVLEVDLDVLCGRAENRPASPTPAPPHPPQRRRRVLAVGCLAVLLLALGFCLGALWQGYCSMPDTIVLYNTRLTYDEAGALSVSFTPSVARRGYSYTVTVQRAFARYDSPDADYTPKTVDAVLRGGVCTAVLPAIAASASYNLHLTVANHDQTRNVYIRSFQTAWDGSVYGAKAS